MERPTMANTIVTESKNEYCRIAEIMPKGIPKIIAMSMDRAASLIVAGKADRISPEIDVEKTVDQSFATLAKG